MNKHKAPPQDIFLLINNNQCNQAVNLLVELIVSYPDDANYPHLLGLAYLKLENFSRAVKHLQYALKIDSKNPELLHNLGLTFIKLNQSYDAEACFVSALKLFPDYVEARRSLIKLKIKEIKLDEAREYLDYAINKPNLMQHFLPLLGEVSRLEENWDVAINTYEVLVESNPNNSSHHYNLGICNLDVCEYERAKNNFKQLISIKPKHIQGRFRLAITELESGNLESAYNGLEDVLRLDPLHCYAHKSINELIWQMGDIEDYGQSYEKLVDQGMLKNELLSDYIQCLLALEKYQKAEFFLLSQIEKYGVSCKYLLLSIYKLTGRVEKFENIFKEINHSVYRKYALKDYAEILVQFGRYAEADELLQNQLFSLDQSDQSILGLQSLVWKQINPEKYHWLCDYEAFIKKYHLNNFNSYSDELKQYLLDQHLQLNEPKTQTLRGGSQIPGKFLRRKNPVVSKLKRDIDDVIHEYLCEVGFDAAHPFRKFNNKKYRIKGSWSVKLKPGGYHVSHVHSEGWISSSVYIDVPEAKAINNGSIYFGKGPDHLDKSVVPELEFLPKPGDIVLFPSYVWHGTYKFKGPGVRLTTPFDIGSLD